MSTHEPPADRDGSPASTDADSPSRSVLVPGAGSGAEAGADSGAEIGAEIGADSGGGWLSHELLWLVASCVLILLLVNGFVARPFAVPSGSMENTLRPGDRLVVNLLAYDLGGHVQRGDVVVFDGIGSFLPYAQEPSGLRKVASDLGLAPTGDSVYVKRVIGVGGDRVTCCGTDGRIRVNGVPLEESGYLFPGDVPSQVPFDVVVPAGKLWVMGDHRGDSSDSRDHLGQPGGGFVPEDKVIGRAEWVVFPLGHWTSLDRPSAFAALPGTVGHGAGTVGHG